MWGVAPGGVWRFSGDSVTKYQFQVSPISAAFGESDLWVGGTNFSSNRNPILLRFDGNEWMQYGVDDGLPVRGNVETVAIDSSGMVWAGISLFGVDDVEEDAQEASARLEGRLF